MSTALVWLIGLTLLLTNLAILIENRQLRARLKELNNPEEYLIYLRKLSADKDKIKSIKALRKRYPELSLVEANQLWQQI